MLIDSYDLDIFTPPCNPGEERFSAIARLKVDISKVLPYLNATLPGVVYHKTANALTWKTSGHNVAFHAHKIAISNVEDREAAARELDEVIQLVNSTWERCAEITPDTETHQRPTPIAVFKLLPQTNCKQCGEETCYIFALKLSIGQRYLADCHRIGMNMWKSERSWMK